MSQYIIFPVLSETNQNPAPPIHLGKSPGPLSKYLFRDTGEKCGSELTFSHPLSQPILLPGAPSDVRTSAPSPPLPLYTWIRSPTHLHPYRIPVHHLCGRYHRSLQASRPFAADQARRPV